MEPDRTDSSVHGSKSDPKSNSQAEEEGNECGPGGTGAGDHAQGEQSEEGTTDGTKDGEGGLQYPGHLFRQEGQQQADQAEGGGDQLGDQGFPFPGNPPSTHVEEEGFDKVFQRDGGQGVDEGGDRGEGAGKDPRHKKARQSRVRAHHPHHEVGKQLIRRLDGAFCNRITILEVGIHDDTGEDTAGGEEGRDGPGDEKCQLSLTE